MDELDAYSRTVSAVAAERRPARSAAVRAGRGSGSAVVADDGVLVTNAHVVGGRRRGRGRPSSTARRCDGGGARHRPAVRPRRAARPAGDAPPPPVARRRRRAASSASWWWPSATRWAWPARSPPGVVSGLGRSLPTRSGRAGPGGRGRHPDRRRAQPGQLRRRAGRRLGAGGRHQHRRRRRRARARGADQRDHAGGSSARCSPTAGCAAPTSASSARRRRCRPTLAERYGRAARPAGRRGDRRQPRRPRRAARGRPGARRRPRARSPTRRACSASCSRRDRAAAAGHRAARRGAMVDVIAVPTELADH